jgi:hypothetical protein
VRKDGRKGKDETDDNSIKSFPSLNNSAKRDLQGRKNLDAL